MSNASSNWPLYSCLDAAVTFKVWNKIKDEVYSDLYRDCYREVISWFDPMLFISTKGLLIDKEQMERVKEEVEIFIKEKQFQLDALCGSPLNVNSPKQCQQYFYGILGHRPYLSTTGRITTDDKAMARLSRKGVKEAKLVQEIRAKLKLLNTYLKVQTDDDNRIRCAINPRGTVTFRFSTSETVFGTGLNYQNLHPEFKSFIIPDPGKFFLELDKKGSEWVISAYASGDAKMIEIIESGRDPHIATGHMITGVSEELIKIESELLKHQTDPDIIFQIRQEKIPQIFEEATHLPRSMTCRQAGKKSNHGLNYYMGYKRYAFENEIPETEAKIHVERYRNGYCNLPIWWDSIARKLSKDRIIVNCFGFPRRFLGENNHELLKAAIAYIPQSTNVIMLNKGMKKIYDETDPVFDPTELCAQVHDSLLYQYPIGKWKDCAKMIIKAVEHLTPILKYEGREFTVKTDLSVGMNWGSEGETNPNGMSGIPLTNNITELADRLEAWYGERVA